MTTKELNRDFDKATPGRDADPATYYVYDRLDGESSADMGYDAAVAECRRLNAAD